MWVTCVGGAAFLQGSHPLPAAVVAVTGVLLLSTVSGTIGWIVRGFLEIPPGSDGRADPSGRT